MLNRRSDYLSVSSDSGGTIDENSWAVTYGDVVTLLLVFFILIASAADVSTAKFERLKKLYSDEKTTEEELEETLQGVIDAHNLNDKVLIQPKADGVHVIIKNDLLFVSASASITESNQAKIMPIIKSFHSLPPSYNFSIEGHTDDVPINSVEFPSNWHLSTERALSILNLFLGDSFENDRLHIQGFADQKPLFPNIDKQGKPILANRQKNRRATIRIY